MAVPDTQLYTANISSIAIGERKKNYKILLSSNLIKPDVYYQDFQSNSIQHKAYMKLL